MTTIALVDSWILIYIIIFYLIHLNYNLRVVYQTHRLNCEYENKIDITIDITFNDIMTRARDKIACMLPRPLQERHSVERVITIRGPLRPG